MSIAEYRLYFFRQSIDKVSAITFWVKYSILYRYFADTFVEHFGETDSDTLMA